MRLPIFVLMIAAISVNGFAQPATAKDVNHDGVVSLLVPIAFSQAQTLRGAQGTIWGGEIWYRNGSTQDVVSLQPTGICMPFCGIGFPAGNIDRVWAVNSNKNNGAMLHVPSAVADSFHVSARVREYSRNAQPTGVEIPVISESEFFRGEQWFLAVPTGEGVRSAIRVYDPRALPETSVQADFFSSAGELLDSITLRPGDDPYVYHIDNNRKPVNVPTIASVLNLTAAFPSLANHEYVHIRVRPLQDGREYWGMVSVTHNETQHVLIITAQP